jgi:hypothetical protein
MAATTILAKADDATHNPWGRNIETTTVKLCLAYVYNYAHDTNLVKEILNNLATADCVRNLMAAPTLGTAPGSTNTVNDALFHMQHIVFNNNTSKEGTAALATRYRSDLSKKTACFTDSRSKKHNKDRG